MDDSDHPRTAPVASVSTIGDDQAGDLDHEWVSDDDDLPPFLTPREAARRLRVSVWAVYEAVKAETLPALRVGRNIRIPRHAVVVQRPADSPSEG